GGEGGLGEKGEAPEKKNRRGPPQSDSQGFGAAVGQDSNELLVEEVVLGPDGFGNPLLVDLAAQIDFLLEPLVNVPFRAALFDGPFVVELDLRHAQPREPPGLRSLLLLVFRRERAGEAPRRL